MKAQQIKAGPNHGELTVFAPCSVTCCEYSVVVRHDAWRRWQDGMMVQDAFPDLTPEQREFLMSGITPAEWQKIFG